jgi:hypothetical protein
MRKTLILTIIVLFLAILAFAANKESGSTTLKDVQPAGTTDKKHKKQQFDLSFATSKNDYTCRTNENQKVQATDFVVGTTITFKIDGNKGQVKSTSTGKSAKCTLVRVAALSAPPQ